MAAKVWVFLLVFIFSLSSSRAEFFRHFTVPPIKKLHPQEKTKIMASMSCQIEDHFNEYVEHLVETVLFRIENELSFLLRPHISIEGERIQVAEEVDSSDLFHVHVRMPAPPLRLHPLLFDLYVSPDVYHLLYHSFERSTMFIQKWKQELATIKDPILSLWLADVEEHILLQNQMQDMKNTQDMALVDLLDVDLMFNSPLDGPLTEEQINYFSNLWYKYINLNTKHSKTYKDWIIKLLKTRLRLIDPQTVIFDNNVFAHSQNVISTGNEFLILDEMNLPNYTQFANIYFEDRADMPTEIETLIDLAEARGESAILRGQELFNEAVKSFKFIQNNLNVFKYIYGSFDSSQNHRVISWTDKYVFSISFSLNCPYSTKEDSSNKEDSTEEEDSTTSTEEEEKILEEEDSTNTEEEDSTSTEEEDSTSTEEEDSTSTEEEDSKILLTPKKKKILLAPKKKILLAQEEDSTSTEEEDSTSTEEEDSTSTEEGRFY